MGIPVMILGESGTGKSTSLRNLNPETTIVIQPIKKRLPFRSSGWLNWDSNSKTGQLFNTDNWQIISTIISLAPSYGKTQIIIDDFQYIMAHEYMRRSDETGFKKFTEMASHIWSIVMACESTPDNVSIYFMQHTEVLEGRTKAKTIGKMLDEKITLEGMFSIVFKTVVNDEGYFFSTKNSGFDTVKTPMDMFSEPLIDNDLQSIDQTIKQYFGV